MKIAIESNDGITIKSPFIKTKGYLVYDIDESHINGFEYRQARSQKRKKHPCPCILIPLLTIVRQ